MNNDEDYNDYYTWSTKQPQGMGCKTWNAPDNQELGDIQKCCKSDKNKSLEDTICYMCVFVPCPSLPALSQKLLGLTVKVKLISFAR